MFYCDKCADKKGWPKDTLMKSSGSCEICNKRAVCNDLPSKYLPPEKESKKQRGCDFTGCKGECPGAY